MTATKIFVDLNDEITFVIEAILAASSERVILIAPQHSLVTSSPVSIKLLAMEVFRSKKLVILVTEDGYAQKTATSVGLIVTSKISNVNPQMWEQSLIIKTKFLEAQDEKRKILLAERTEKLIYEAGSMTDRGQPEKEEAAPAVAPATEEKIVLPIQRPRREAKMVQLGKIKIVAGGDAASFYEKKEAATGEEETIEIGLPKNKKGYAGADWNGVITRTKLKRNIVPKVKIELKLPKRILLVTFFTSLIALILAGFYLYFVWKVDVRITLKTSEASIKKSITADVDQKELDKEKLIIPARLLDVKGLTISSTQKTTGKSFKGAAAKGEIQIWNKTSSPVTLPAGTILTHEVTDSQGAKKPYTYKLDVQITIPAQVADSEEVLQPGGVNVYHKITATAVGPEYNFDSVGFTDMTVAGYGVANLVAKLSSDISGGEKTEINVVSQDDINKLKQSLKDNLLAQGQIRITEQLGESLYLIKGSEIFVEKSAIAEPVVDKEAEEFTMDFVAEMSALAVRQEDLKLAIESVIDSGAGVVFRLEGLDDILITNASRNKNTITFIVASNASLAAQISPVEVSAALAGKSVKEAESWLSNNPAIESFGITYHPEFLRILPFTQDKFVIRIQKP